MDLAEKLASKPQFVSPTAVLKELGVTSGMNVIDYACGAGHWSLAAAKLVAPSGKVLAIENDINQLNRLKSQAEIQKLNNLEIEELELEKGTSKTVKLADLVIVSNILYLIEDKRKFLGKAVKMIAPGGRLLFIDWANRDTLFGPPVELRLNQEEVITMLEAEGLKFSCTVDAGLDHFGLVFLQEGAKNEG